MKRIFLVVLVLGLVACGKRNTETGPEVVCEVDMNPTQVVYPDGIERKSTSEVCSNGCTYFYFVNDESVFFKTCN